MRTFKLEDIKALTELPDDHQVEWLLDAEGSIAFLQANANSDEIVIYASTKCVHIDGLLALTRKLTPSAVSELRHCNMPMSNDCWRIQRVWGGGKGYRMYLEGPLSDINGLFKGGEKLIFRRSFSGVSRGSTPVELSQKLVHSLALHFVPERNAYCRLDSRGDIEDVIKIININGKSMCDAVCAVTILRRDLDKFMALSKTSLVLRFDFTRIRWASFGGWGEIRRYERDTIDLYYQGGVNGQGSYCEGAMVIHPSVTVADLIREWKAEEKPSKRMYATFKIYDRKNQVNVETSCGP
jgi:hypothetical protein